MPPALKVKQFGLPRYIWLVMLAGGVGVGLYIRHKRAQDNTGTQQDTTSADASSVTPDTTDYSSNAGLPVGFYDAASGATVPNAAGSDTTGAFDINGFLEGLGALGLGKSGNATETATGTTKVIKQPIKTGKPAHTTGGGKGSSRHHAPQAVSGGGPPNRPNPKINAKPHGHGRPGSGSGLAALLKRPIYATNTKPPKQQHRGGHRP